MLWLPLGGTAITPRTHWQWLPVSFQAANKQQWNPAKRQLKLQTQGKEQRIAINGVYISSVFHLFNNITSKQLLK